MSSMLPKLIAFCLFFLLFWKGDSNLAAQRSLYPNESNVISQIEGGGVLPVNKTFATIVETEQVDSELIIKISFQNVSTENLQIAYGAKVYNFVITNEEGKEVYRSDVNKPFASYLIEADFKKGEKLSYIDSWNLKNQQSIAVPKGKYTLKVTMLINITTPKVDVSSQELTSSTIIKI